MTQISPADSGGHEVERYSPADSRLSEETLARLKRSVPANTYAAYKRELERYRPWCAEQRRVDVPATSETFAEYANHLAETGLAPRSVERAACVMRWRSRSAGGSPARCSPCPT